MKILATGGAGYVGSHCVRALCDAGHSVVVLDNMQKGHRAAVDSRATLIIGDLSDMAALHRVLADHGFDAVMHFAALAEVGESVRDPLLYYRANVISSVVLLEAMREHDVRNLVFSSSCAVYGTPPAVPIAEDMPRLPISPYGRTKLVMEWAIEDCTVAWGLGATALRYFNAAGAAADGTIGEDHEPESHLIPRVLQAALASDSDREPGLTIFGDDYDTPDGTCVRDYVHVEDLAAVHRLAVESQQTGEFRCYNVGTGRGHSVMEVIEAARRVTGHPIPTTLGPRRPGDPPALFADPARVARELGWRPRYANIEEIIATAWNWHRTHPNGFA